MCSSHKITSREYSNIPLDGLRRPRLPQRKRKTIDYREVLRFCNGIKQPRERICLKTNEGKASNEESSLVPYFSVPYF